MAITINPSPRVNCDATAHFTSGIFANLAASNVNMLDKLGHNEAGAYPKGVLLDDTRVTSSVTSSILTTIKHIILACQPVIKYRAPISLESMISNLNEADS